MSTDANALSIIKPLAISNSSLITGGSPALTNVPENDHATWSSATTYAAGDRVILVSTHRIYESLQAGNLNKNPVTETLWWIEVGPTNRWALFDTSVSTQTVQADYIKYTLEPGRAINSLAVLNITEGTEIVITMTSPATGSPGIVYERTVDLTSLPLTSDWWAFFYGQRVAPSQSILLDLPSYTDCVITIEISGSANLAVGVLLIGQQQNFGIGISHGVRVGIQDYSRKETNEFGDTILVQRAFAKRANFDLMIKKAEVDSLQNTLSSIRAQPVLWVGSNAYESTTLFGFYKNFDILISYPEHSDCSLEIEGLT
ncbi:MAG: hypothetical protein Q7U57_14440 [Methylovulum sp.]|nr:hypothetical protein [Methylovulum sp.]